MFIMMHLLLFVSNGVKEGFYFLRIVKIGYGTCILFGLSMCLPFTFHFIKHAHQCNSPDPYLQ